MRKVVRGISCGGSLQAALARTAVVRYWSLAPMISVSYWIRTGATITTARSRKDRRAATTALATVAGVRRSPCPSCRSPILGLADTVRTGVEGRSGSLFRIWGAVRRHPAVVLPRRASAPLALMAWRWPDCWPARAARDATLRWPLLAVVLARASTWSRWWDPAASWGGCGTPLPVVLVWHQRWRRHLLGMATPLARLAGAGRVPVASPPSR